MTFKIGQRVVVVNTYGFQKRCGIIDYVGQKDPNPSIIKVLIDGKNHSEWVGASRVEKLIEPNDIMKEIL